MWLSDVRHRSVIGDITDHMETKMKNVSVNPNGTYQYTSADLRARVNRYVRMLFLDECWGVIMVDVVVSVCFRVSNYCNQSHIPVFFEDP